MAYVLLARLPYLTWIDATATNVECFNIQQILCCITILSDQGI